MNNAQVMLGHMATAAYYISSLDCSGGGDACAAEATCVRQAAAADGQSSTTTWAAAKVKATSPHRRPNTSRVFQNLQSNLSKVLVFREIEACNPFQK